MNDRLHLNRRTLLQGSAATAGAALLGPAFARPGLGAAAQDQVTVSWWEHFPEGLNKSVRDNYMATHPNVTIELTGYPPNEMNQALQLAFQSEQMHDITTTPGAAGTSIQNLIREGWFQPLPNGDAIMAAMPAGALQEGLTVFGGQVYSMPIFTFRQYASLNWFNTQLMESAGFDPAIGPRTWDEFRQAATAITQAGNGQIFGWIQGINFPDRMAQLLDELAQTAGAPGPIDFTTGAFAHASEPYAMALEFLLSLQADGVLFPASLTLDARNARARWATGVGGMFFDGPWNVGVVQADFDAFLPQINVAPIPAPEANSANYIHVGPPGGTFWVSTQSENADVAADILLQMTTPEYYAELAARMDQPPLDLTVLDTAEVHPTYQQAIQFFQERVLLAPSPVVRNVAVSDVTAEMAPITPDLGTIVMGAFSGDVADPRAALKQYADAMTAERDRAIKVVQDSGKQVSVDDWVFADWAPDQDYNATPATPVAALKG